MFSVAIVKEMNSTFQKERKEKKSVDDSILEKGTIRKTLGISLEKNKRKKHRYIHVHTHTHLYTYIFLSKYLQRTC